MFTPRRVRLYTFFVSKFFLRFAQQQKTQGGNRAIGPKLIFFDGSSELGQDRAQRERARERIEQKRGRSGLVRGE